MFGKKGFQGESLTSSESEDAYVLTSGGVAIADGVGSWNRFGFNPGEFSSELMLHCADIFLQDFGFSNTLS